MSLGLLQPSLSDSHNRSNLESEDRNDSPGAPGDQKRLSQSKNRKPRPKPANFIEKESSRILSNLFGVMPGMSYRSSLDGDLTIEFAGSGCTSLTGYSSDELISNPTVKFVDLIHPEDRETALGRIASAVQLNGAYDIVYRIISRTGELHWVRDIGREIHPRRSEPHHLEGYLIDITDRKEAERQVKNQLRLFEALRTIDATIASSFDLRVTFDIILQQITTQLEIDAADVLLLVKADQALKFVAGRGFNTESLQHTYLRVGEGFAGQAAIEKRIVRASLTGVDFGGLKRAPDLAREGFVAYFGVPLIARGQVKGILELFQRSPLDPDGEWLQVLNALAGQAAIAIDNATLLSDLQRSNTQLAMAYDATLEGWSRALEMRESGTDGHNRRVTELTLRLAQLLSVRDSDLINLRRGALLHDIGKLAVPDRILFKSYSLTDEEWRLMRLHPVYAYQLLSPIQELHSALDIPYCHHEKWDGSGYPRGLKEAQVPLAARIFAVIDVWDALNSDRPFRPAWERERVLTYLRDQSGKHFDPEIVWAFIQMIG